MGTFAPFFLPFERRRQTGAVLLWILLVPFCLGLFLYTATFPTFWPLILLYTTYIYYDVAPDHGGRRVDWVRRWPLWSWFGGFFPVRVLRECELDPRRTYVLGYHPHGIISIGAFTNFGTEATGIGKLLPNLNLRLLTLASNFNLPIYRDLLLSLGLASVSKRSCERILAKGPGNGVVIVVGGAAESLNAHPGTCDLTLRRRLGFVKVAIRAGADLVPVISFGENDIFDQVDNHPGTKVRTFQRHFQSVFGFTTPLFHGRGIFQYKVGIIPFRRPIVTIIGKPLPVEMELEPSRETVQRYHEAYMNALRELYDKHKDTYAKDRIRDMRFVE